MYFVFLVVAVAGKMCIRPACASETEHDGPEIKQKTPRNSCKNDTNGAFPIGVQLGTTESSNTPCEYPFSAIGYTCTYLSIAIRTRVLESTGTYVYA